VKHEHEHEDQHDHGPGPFDAPAMVAYAEQEAEVLISAVADAVEVLSAMAGRDGLDVRRVLDIGCGPGVGSCRLAEQFGAATVVAVDSSAAMLDAVTRRAGRLGLAARVETRLAELPEGIDTLGRAELVWASLVLHHIDDEVDALGRIRRQLEPGGLVAVVEQPAPIRVVPDDVELGRPGIWTRVDAAWAGWFAAGHARPAGPRDSGDPTTTLAHAGFDVVADRELTVDVEPPLDDRTRRFARAQLARTSAQLAGQLDVDDRGALARLLDDAADEGIMRREDARVRATRRLVVGRPLG
jgi:SAM-dependent methyltransferase